MRGCECSESHGPCMEVRLAERLPDELTSLHEPQTSHLDLLSAFLPSETNLRGLRGSTCQKISLARIWRSEPHSLGTSLREVQTGRAFSVRPSVSLARLPRIICCHCMALVPTRSFQRLCRLPGTCDANNNPKYGDGIEWKLKQDADFLRDA